ncbi:uncharacterized protein LOC132057525 [Lycium ferocissimum]|uniref:uncharacterized protein LOC132057525 n=1 Tax=Lycium ferocissimum TaxID=112874 RepID=UPI0028153A60|nr:uncharacterized protein LOC132057525 [Lycium ferocissimum]
MISILSWNIRSVRTQSAFARLKTLKNQYNLSFIGLQEPIVKAEHLPKYMRSIDMQGCYSNINNKIWLFWNNDYTVSIINDTEQQVTCKVIQTDNGEVFYITTVYAKCRSHLRNQLWEEINILSQNINGPWCTMGDFNVIAVAEEKEGGSPHRIERSFDFIHCLESSGLQDAGFSGNPFTWCNNRGAPDTIWKRLDRFLYNVEWFEKYGFNTVTHLARACSDHVPLLIQFSVTEEPYFLEVVKEVWDEECQGNPLWILHQKLKKTASRLSRWSRETFGNIHENPKKWESDIMALEQKLLEDNNEGNRTNLSRTKAGYIQYLKNQESILKQKARVNWLKEGDSNSAYFHKVIKDRRRRLCINKIQDEHLQWVEGTQRVAEAAVRYFQGVFCQIPAPNDFSELKVVDHVISPEVNQALTEFPDEEEIKNCVFNMDPDSASGPDGFSAKFYQSCWSIISHEVVQAMEAFFCGANLPKWLTHTCIVMLPKVSSPQQFLDIRPISLCNVISKIFAKVLSTRLNNILPSIISTNQSGFIKGRSITENILLAQEIIQDIEKADEKGNVVSLKLDMDKAYDRVSWPYLCILMRKMGFCELWIDLIYKHISSNWYSLIINGTRQGFFKSERGLRQGDPISPSLFVICAEFLSKKLNKLNGNADFKGFYMNKKGPKINHLAFADDIILFSSGCRKSLMLLMETLQTYEEVSGQLINRHKSSVSLASNVEQGAINRVELITGMVHKNFPIKYLGCPLFNGRKNAAVFSEMMNRVLSKINGWHTRFLSSGGKAVLIRHVLLALPIHMLAAVHPPKSVMNQMEKMLNKFFWGGSEEKNNYHWSSWDNMCYPYEEGGAKFRKIQDTCNAFTTKQWWNLRTGQSLWKDFMLNKYCQRIHPVVKRWYSGNSHSWNAMCKIKRKMDNHILWKIGKGDIAIWYDNWTSLGALVNYLPEDRKPRNQKLSEVLVNGQWRWGGWDLLLPNEVLQTIQDMHISLDNSKMDRPLWTAEENGKFSVFSAWQILRNRRERNWMDTMTWQKRVPFKMNFMVWRILRDRVPVDARIAKMGINIPSKCICCRIPQNEELDHLFYAGQFATEIWSILCGPVGIPFTNKSYRQLITTWWQWKFKNPIQTLIGRIIPSITTWEIWRTRCGAKYGKERPNIKISLEKIAFIIAQVVQGQFKSIHPEPDWYKIIQIMEFKFSCRTTTMVKWIKPPNSFVKINSDGSCKDGQCGGGESDSKILVDSVNEAISIPWRMIKEVEELRQYIEQTGFIMQHCYREGNKVADKLAALSHGNTNNQTYYVYEDLPNQVKGLMTLDRWSLPAFRTVKKARSNIKYDPP